MVVKEIKSAEEMNKLIGHNGVFWLGELYDQDAIIQSIVDGMKRQFNYDLDTDEVYLIRGTDDTIAQWYPDSKYFHELSMNYDMLVFVNIDPNVVTEEKVFGFGGIYLDRALNNTTLGISPEERASK